MAKVGWQKGGTADVVKLEGDAIVLRSTIPSPPGSRVPGVVVNTEHLVCVKVHTSKRQDDGSFVIEGRLIDATRELRALLNS